MEQNCPELEKQFGVLITRHTPTIKLSKQKLKKIDRIIWRSRNFGSHLKASINRNPNLQWVGKLDYLIAELEEHASVVISGLEQTLEERTENWSLRQALSTQR